jgi:hypothetical protein
VRGFDKLSPRTAECSQQAPRKCACPLARKKNLELATKYGKVDAGRAARKKLSLVRFRLTVERFRMSYFLTGCRHCIGDAEAPTREFSRSF